MKKFLMGTIVGSVLTASLTLGGVALADNGDTLTAIERYLHFKFDGQEQPLPSDYTSIMYNGHVYVPARFVAEQLGAKVGWDDTTQTVTFQTGSTVAGDPQPMPASFSQQMVTVTVTSIEQKADRSVFHVKVTNNSANPISVAQNLSQLVVNGSQSNYPNLNDTDGSPTDMQWMNDVQAGATQEGTITMKAITNGSNSVKLYLPIQFHNELSQFNAVLNIQLNK